MKKKLMAIIAVAAMVVTMVPSMVFADSVATPANIVDVLKNATEGETITLSDGEYDLSGLLYVSFAKDLTIVGGENVTVKGLSFQGQDAKNAFVPENLKLLNIKFTDDFEITNNTVKGLSVIGCTFSNNAVLKIANNDTKSPDGLTVNGLTVKDCTFGTTDTSDNTSLLVQGTVNNVVIENNTFDGAGHNAIQIPGQIKGTLKINGNKISNTGDRALRLGTLDNNATATISNNTLNNAADADEEIIKFTSVANATVELSNNTYNGKNILATVDSNPTNNSLVYKATDICSHEDGWDAGVVTKEPTTDAEGVKTFTCTACGAEKTEAIAKLPAVPAATPAKPEASPNTGDNNMAPFAVAGLALAAMAAVAVTRRRTN